MEIQHLQQRKGCNRCGQYCIAMIVGTNPDYVAMRAKKYSTTKMYQWREMLNSWRILTAKRAKKFTRIENLPNYAMLRIVWKDKKIGHAVVYKDGIIYDPFYGVYGISEYPFEQLNGAIKSYLEITGRY